MEITHEYLHHRAGYRFGSHCCWLCIYEGSPGDAPVVLASEPAKIGGADLEGMSEYLAAEVIQRHFAAGSPHSLPDLPRPLLWIERRPNRRPREPSRYFLLDFPGYEPRPAGPGFVRPITLGPPRREEIKLEEVATLMRQ